MVKIIDGEAAARQVRATLQSEVRELSSAGISPKLAAILATENKGAHIYAKSQARSCAEVGIEYQLVEVSPTSDQTFLTDTVERLNQDPTVHGIIVQLPLPKDVRTRVLQGQIAPSKDVEGVSAANQGRIVYAAQPFFKKPAVGEQSYEEWLERSLTWPLPMPAPCTAIGMMRLIRSLGKDLYGMEAVVVGHSEIVGKPMALLLMAHFCTTTVCHIATQDLASHTKRADILVVGVGKPGLITANMVKPGAIVIDAGINRIKVQDKEGKTKTRVTGDVDFDTVRNVSGFITPVPGGVGPMTTAMLLANTVRSAEASVRGGKG